MTDPPFHLRLATSGDARGCAFVHHTAWVETYSELLPRRHWETDTLSRRAESWRRRLDGGTAVTVAETGGQIFGFAMTTPARTIGAHEPVRELELSSLYVLAAHHGRGAGQALLDAVLRPDTPAQLWVLEENPRARRFYERNGFAADSARCLEESLSLTEVRHVR
ncbi:GNAT family N-acetyltransferase [Brachybacterium vulturis]|uniref:GNAT family N-acetyltransferase n=1 Tax=Brachybacterium vulturis TaxID=2017484 RepID=UPI003736B182